MKDFLFFTYSFVRGANFYFRKIQESGYQCDFVDENTIHHFKPTCKYKYIVLYLHEPGTIPITNHLINTYFQDSILIQHDDTDDQNVQIWSNKKPDLILQREYIESTNNVWGSPILPFHFPIHSRFDENYKDKEIDISFMGNITNSRRVPFVNFINNLSQTSLKHLNWHIDIAGGPTWDNPEFARVINSSKIGLHFYGNSYDSIRIWELASVGCAILMPKLRLKSTSKEWIEFTEYETFEEDFSDLEEKILHLLSEERYKKMGNLVYNAYNLRHNPDKCFEKYFENLKPFLR